MRINKFLSHFSKLSRRQADTAISEGRVEVNDKPAEVGQMVSESDQITLDNLLVSTNQYTYLLLNKPTGYITSRKQQGDDPTIYDLLPEKYHSLKPVGRLDKDTSGLLLLTNDGDYAEQLLHPKNQKEKVYHLELDKFLRNSEADTIQSKGIALKDGVSKMSVEAVNAKEPIYEVRIREGRNRQIRRTFEHLHYEIVSLKRTSFGKYSLDKLKASEFLETSR